MFGECEHIDLLLALDNKDILHKPNWKKQIRAIASIADVSIIEVPKSDTKIRSFLKNKFNAKIIAESNNRQSSLFLLTQEKFKLRRTLWGSVAFPEGRDELIIQSSYES